MRNALLSSRLLAPPPLHIVHNAFESACHWLIVVELSADLHFAASSPSPGSFRDVLFFASVLHGGVWSRGTASIKLVEAFVPALARDKGMACGE